MISTRKAPFTCFMYFWCVFLALVLCRVAWAVVEVWL